MLCHAYTLNLGKFILGKKRPYRASDLRIIYLLTQFTACYMKFLKSRLNKSLGTYLYHIPNVSWQDGSKYTIPTCFQSCTPSPETQK